MVLSNTYIEYLKCFWNWSFKPVPSQIAYFYSLLDSVKRLKFPVGTTKGCPWFGPNLLAYLAGPGLNFEQTKDKLVCFLKVFWSVLQNQWIQMSYLRRGWLKTPSETFFLTFLVGFSIPIIFPIWIWIFSNVLDLRNLQEQVKKTFFFKNAADHSLFE